jgi:hypothetical protein
MAHSEASLSRRQASGNVWNQCDAPLIHCRLFGDCDPPDLGKGRP